MKGFQKPRAVDITGFRMKHEGDEYYTLEFTDEHNRTAFVGKVPPEALMALSNKIQHFFEDLAREGVEVGLIRENSGVEPTILETMNGHVTDALYMVCQEQVVDMKALFCRMFQKDHIQSDEELNKGLKQVFDALVEAGKEQEGR